MMRNSWWMKTRILKLSENYDDTEIEYTGKTSQQRKWT